MLARRAGAVNGETVEFRLVGADRVAEELRLDARAAEDGLLRDVEHRRDGVHVHGEERVIRRRFGRRGVLRSLHVGGDSRREAADVNGHALRGERCLRRDVQRRAASAAERRELIDEVLRDDETGEVARAAVALLETDLVLVAGDAVASLVGTAELGGHSVGEEVVGAASVIGRLFGGDAVAAAGFDGLVAVDLRDDFGVGRVAGFDLGDLRDSLVEFLDFQLQRLNVGEFDFGDVTILVRRAGESRVDERSFRRTLFGQLREEGVSHGFLLFWDVSVLGCRGVDRPGERCPVWEVSSAGVEVSLLGRIANGAKVREYFFDLLAAGPGRDV